MSWRNVVLALMLSVVLISCGKNDPIVPYGGNSAPIQAPPPPNYTPGGGYGGGYGPGNGGYGGGGYSPNQFFPQPQLGNFMPQMPQQRPPQFYPFVPIDNYMRRDPRLQQYWQRYWQQWQGYAQQHNYSQYNFSAFWFDYSSRQWGNGQWSQIYQYFDSNFYYWTQPGIQFTTGGSRSPEYFWQNCSGFPMPQYDLCDSGC